MNNLIDDYSSLKEELEKIKKLIFVMKEITIYVRMI